MKVKIEQRHIDKGVRGNKHFCAIAQALIELFPDKKISVTGDRVIIGDKQYYLYAKGREFIIEFDALKDPEPFEAKLLTKLPNETVTIGAK
jgi:hypothetical protein